MEKYLVTFQTDDDARTFFSYHAMANFINKNEARRPPFDVLYGLKDGAWYKGKIIELPSGRLSVKFYENDY